MNRLKKLELRGWKSFRSVGLDLGRLNVLVGRSGSGKSNLVSLFKMFNELIGERMQAYIAGHGGSEALLYNGSRETPMLDASFHFETETGESRYCVRLVHAAVDSLLFTEEKLEFHRLGFDHPQSDVLGAGHRETKLNREANRGNDTARVIRGLVGSCRVFNFSDTSSSARIRNRCYAQNDRFLMPDAGNLAAMLARYQQQSPECYDNIVETVRQILPGFDTFLLEPKPGQENYIRLNWKETGNSHIFGAQQFPDGTLRAIAIATLLLQPQENLPTVIILDEPEAGLDPLAISVVAPLIERTADRCQLIVATQSSAFLDYFEADDITIVERIDQETKLRRLSAEELEPWLDEYDMNEQWEEKPVGEAS
ncbi:MAG: AAA family ATPase [Pirellulales bacterium]|nr:AAA family ATPase [Pirellulales bacterium]